MDLTVFYSSVDRYATFSTRMLYLVSLSFCMRQIHHSLLNQLIMTGSCHFIMFSSHQFQQLPWEFLTKMYLQDIASRCGHYLPYKFNYVS